MQCNCLIYISYQSFKKVMLYHILVSSSCAQILVMKWGSSSISIAIASWYCFMHNWKFKCYLHNCSIYCLILNILLKISLFWNLYNTMMFLLFQCLVKLGCFSLCHPITLFDFTCHLLSDFSLYCMLLILTYVLILLCQILESTLYDHHIKLATGKLSKIIISMI